MVSSQSSFTYQGTLNVSGSPANGRYDFEFRLFAAPTNGTMYAGPFALSGVSVSNGLFTALIDFGSLSFDGSPRWLEISVKTNSGGGSFTVLAPRCSITPVPQALYAAAAQSAVVAQSVANPVLGTNLTIGSSLSIQSSNLYSWIGISNGMVAVPAWNNGINQSAPGLQFFNTNGAWEGGIESWANHGGAPDTPELLISSARNIALQTGKDARGSGGLQLGTSGENGIQYNQYGGTLMWDANSNDGLTAWPIGHSSRFGWHVQGAQSISHYSEGMPGVVGVAASTNVYFPNMEYGLLGELWFYSLVPQMAGRIFVHQGIRVGRMLTNGWDFRGPMIQERVTDVSTSACPLDFNRAACVDISISAADSYFFTTNTAGTASNYEARVFLIRSGFVAAANLHWPSGWMWLGSAPLITNLASGQLVRLSLESVGDGETNILARAEATSDHAFPIDPDASKFFLRAGIANATQKASVNKLAFTAKQHGWWALCDAIYPFVGGSPASHAQNLKSANFTITWSRTGLAHDPTGVTGDGIAGSGDTGYNSSTSGQFVASSSHLFCFCGTQVPSTSEFGWDIIGSYDSSTRSYIGNNAGAGVVVLAGMNAPALTSIVLADQGDCRGPIIASRTGSNAQFLAIRNLVLSDSATISTSPPSGTIHLLARGYGSGSDHHFGGTLSGASIGAGIDQSTWALMRSDWESFEASLGRGL